MKISKKSTVEDIRQRFDNEVDRFSNLETGQQSTIDAALVLDLIATVAVAHIPQGGMILDLGCGAGNFTLRLLQEIGPLNCHLVDLSARMLERARERLDQSSASAVHTYQTDLRGLDFPENTFDAILAGAVLHHLREEAEWSLVFKNLRHWLKPGGRLYVADLITFEEPATDRIMWKRYGDYLENLGGPEYREKVLAYIEQEDSPRSLTFQTRLLEQVGFSSHDVLHRHSVFACYSALK